jgi:hypothetical protein
VALLLATGAACGGGTDEPEAQPAPDLTRFTDNGTFDAIPRYPRSEPASPRREIEDAIVRTWAVRNTTPEAVLEFYRTTLPGQGWDQVQPPIQVNRSWRGSWLRDEGTLEVSAGPAPTIDDDAADAADPSVQYSLTLRPD